MDKSESELLEEWDLVSSVYDTEQENGVPEKKTDAHSESSTNDNIAANGNTKASVKNSEADSKEVVDVDTETPIDYTSKQIAETVSVSEETGEVDSLIMRTDEVDVSAEQISGSDTAVEEVAEVSDMEEVSAVDVVLEETDNVMERISAIDVVTEEKNICTMEQSSGVDAIMEENNIDLMEKISAVEEIANSDTTECTATNIEINREKTPEFKTVEKTDTENATPEKIDDSDIEKNYAETEKCSYGEDKNAAEAFPCDTEASIKYSSVDNSEDHIVNSSLDSSMEHIQIEHCEGSFVQDVPELIPDLVEQENAAIESSSSDIDIIDENLEESVTSSFLHPLSLSISSSVDTSSILTTPSEGDKELQTEQRTEDIRVSEATESHTEKSSSYSESFKSCTKKLESFPDKTESYFQKPRSDVRDENVQPEPQRPHPRNVGCDMFAGILELLRNMTRFEWSILGGVMLCLYVTIVFNQTNIFAVVEKENVVSQMKKMIDELKNDNKMLKDQMLSEMKNEKVFSSVEHQIKELKKENSKLTHMLYGVAKVLEEQKDTHKRFEKREAEYIAPFKNEINKLKEYINILKFDNEELQKQLVRMRYASYSQGGSDASDDKAKEQKDETKADESTSTEEIALDINSLKKWNELISLLSKELGLSETEPLTGDKPHSDTNNVSWNWKVLLRNFKGTFKDFKANVTSVISDYKNANQKVVSEIYKFVKDFFTVEEENKKHAPPDEESSQWKNIGDFVKDLKEKWIKIKDRIYTSDLKIFIKNFKKSGEADKSKDDHNSAKTKSTTYEYNEQKPTNTHFESGRKHDKDQSNSEDSKWMFKRAELRAELRDAENEDPSENWFLKRKKRTSQDDVETVKY